MLVVIDCVLLRTYEVFRLWMSMFLRQPALGHYQARQFLSLHLHVCKNGLRVCKLHIAALACPNSLRFSSYLYIYIYIYIYICRRYSASVFVDERVSAMRYVCCRRLCFSCRIPFFRLWRSIACWLATPPSPTTYCLIGLPGKHALSTSHFSIFHRYVACVCR